MGRDRHGSRASAPHRNRCHRSCSITALACRAAGAINRRRRGTDFAPVRNFTITTPADAASATGTFTFTPARDDLVERDEAVLVGTSRILDSWTILNDKAS